MSGVGGRPEVERRSDLMRVCADEIVANRTAPFVAGVLEAGRLALSAFSLNDVKAQVDDLRTRRPALYARQEKFRTFASYLGPGDK